MRHSRLQHGDSPHHARVPAARECLVTAVAGIYLGNSELAVKVPCAGSVPIGGTSPFARPRATNDGYLQPRHPLARGVSDWCAKVCRPGPCTLATSYEVINRHPQRAQANVTVANRGAGGGAAEANAQVLEEVFHAGLLDPWAAWLACAPGA